MFKKNLTEKGVKLLTFFIIISLSSSCNNLDKSITNTLFESLSADQTNIYFEIHSITPMNLTFINIVITITGEVLDWEM